jgi:glyoxylase-like metal-dependent hydrolase (beta-lactamase superfamily II)
MPRRSNRQNHTKLLLIFAALLWLAIPVRAACVCPNDVTADGAVNIDDLLGVINQWGPNKGATGDVTGNGVVDIDDLLSVINGWGQVCPVPGVFPAPGGWIHGCPSCANCPPPIQIHQYNADTYILRQSKCTNFEAPFMYLLFGQDKVLLQDTGAGGIQIGPAVYGVINQWLAANNQASIQLIVTHSHGHGDHFAGDSQFNGQPNTTLVGTSQTAVRNFFGITTWPTQIVTYDLGGGRVLDVIPIPGHQSASIALYDRQTGILLTGDTLYPGHLFISAWTDYKASILRLVNFTAAADKPVCHVLGTHIEMTSTPGVHYPYGTVYQPNEHVLQLTRDTLLELNAACQAMGNTPVQQVHDDFIIVP